MNQTMQLWGLVALDNDPTNLTEVETGYRPLACGTRGNQYFSIVGEVGDVIVGVVDADQLSFPAIPDSHGLQTASRLYGYTTGDGQWEALQLQPLGVMGSVDAVASRAIQANAALLGYDIDVDDGTLSNPYVGVAGDTLTDATAGFGLETLAFQELFNGTTYGRARSNGAAVLSGTTQPFGQLVANPGEWTLTNAPAANTIATATRAAGAAGVRHVLRSIQASINAVAAIAAPLTVVVRDGASGAGTILWQDRLTAPIGATEKVSLTGLNIVGSAATAMTIEFTAVPGATNFETVSATGYSTI